MAIAAPEVERPRQYDDPRVRRWRLAGRLVVLLWLAVLLGCVLVGEKKSELWDLENALARGQVAQVQVEGLPDGDPWTGWQQVTLRWEGRFLDRYTEVVVVRGRHGSPGDWADDLPQLPVKALLGRLHGQDAEVDLSYRDLDGGSWGEVMSWRVPGWLVHVTLGVWLSTVILIIGGPEPWRATRWAWFWLILQGGWLGVVAYLLLGGPLGVGEPRAGSRRLTGGWAFLMSLLISDSPT